MGIDERSGTVRSVRFWYDMRERLMNYYEGNLDEGSGEGRLGRRAGGCLLCLSAPLYGEDNEAATRQYNVAVALQNREAYDLAIDAWGSFIKSYPTDPRVTQARHYQGVCHFFTAVGASDAKQTDAALKVV